MDTDAAMATGGGAGDAVDRLGAWGVVWQGLRFGWLALRANAWPALGLWVVAVAIVGGYYAVPSVGAAMDALGAVKDRHGYAFSAVSTALCGAVLPWLVTRFRLGGAGQGRVAFGVLLLVYWAIKGVEVDALYRFQGWLFGTGTDPGTIAAKVALDMLLYMPLWAAPMTLAVYQIERVDGDLRRWWRGLNGRWVTHEALPIVVANWGVWVPAVIGVYLLPSALQLPMQNLVLCLWALMMIFMADEAASAEPTR
ncbi:MAG: hypothetical protein AAF586_00975 [Planctomycetota bacterium]